MYSGRELSERKQTHISSYDPSPTETDLRKMGLNEYDDLYDNPVIHTWMRQRLRAFINLHSIQTVDIIGFNVHFTDRIPQILKDLKNDKNRKKDSSISDVAFVQMDNCWTPDGKPVVYGKSADKKGNHDACRIFSKKHPYNCVGFVNFDMTRVFDYMKKLKSLRHCGFCNAENIMSISFYRDEGKTIAFIDVDTESG